MRAPVPASLISERRLATIDEAELDAWLSALALGTGPHAEGREVRGGGRGSAANAAVWIPFTAFLAMP
ncbi:MAG: hypothetical protein V4531_03775 [Actinomycetota bacterium]